MTEKINKNVDWENPEYNYIDCRENHILSRNDGKQITASAERKHRTNKLSNIASLRGNRQDFPKQSGINLTIE